MTRFRKPLIGVDLPIMRISTPARREKSIRQGHAKAKRPCDEAATQKNTTGTPLPQDARPTSKGVFDVVGLHQPQPRERANHSLWFDSLSASCAQRLAEPELHPGSTPSTKPPLPLTRSGNQLRPCDSPPRSRAFTPSKAPRPPSARTAPTNCAPEPPGKNQKALDSSRPHLRLSVRVTRGLAYA